MSSMSPAYLSQMRAHPLTKNALLVSAVASMMGLTACSSSPVSQPVSQPVAEPTSSTVRQENVKQPDNKRSVQPIVAVAELEMAQPSAVVADSAMSNSIMTRSAPQLSIRPLSGISIQPAARDNYQKNDANPVHRTTEMAVATLSIDTDTGSYANVRRYLNEGQLPSVDAVRVEELINYFNYQFDDGKRIANAPFVVATEVVDSPWDKADQENKIVKVGIKAVENSWSNKTANQVMPPANLVFLVDVSGSMSSRDKLPLAQSSLKLLTEQMRAQDSISIVTYSGTTSVALPVTKKQKYSLQ